jgi:hypothetical protein
MAAIFRNQSGHLASEAAMRQPEAGFERSIEAQAEPTVTLLSG